jgi:hypothetical protein
MKRLLSVWSLLALSASPVLASDYLFALPSVDCRVTVQRDGSLHIAYDFEFVNSGSGRPLDVVDVGFPTSAYRLDSVKASQDGRPLSDIRRSSYIDVGVEVHLDPPIPPGGSSLVHVEGVNPGMVYQDTTDPAFASVRFAPTWFGSQYVQGLTTLTLVVGLPTGVKPDELRWQMDRPWQKLGLVDDRPSAIWVDSVRFDQRRLYGISFPRRLVERVIEQSWVELFTAWYKARPGLIVIVTACMFLVFTVFFFRLTGGTGGCLYVLLLPLWLVPLLIPVSHLALLPVVVLFALLAEKLRRRRRRKYLPAMVSVEGGTIKRGLTAPEAAVLLELPVGKVLTLALFGLARKKIVAISSEQPLRISLNPPWDDGDPGQLAAEQDLPLHPYEPALIQALRGARNGDPATADMSPAFKELVFHTAVRVQGFDLDKTKDYYRRIVARAWKQASSLGEVKQQASVNRNFDWMLMDEDFDRRWRRLPRPYGPSWWPVVMTAGRGSPPAAAPAGGTPGAGSPSLGDVAASLTGRIENLAGSLAGRVDAGVLGPMRPALDLSGFDRVSTDMLKSMAASSGRSGGGGGGCACAGCACACACAGGGR